MVEVIIVVAALVLAGYLLYRKINATVALLGVGVVLMIAAWALGHGAQTSVKAPSTGNGLLDQFAFVAAMFSDRAATIGMIIMVLFGFSAYMTKIGANAATVDLLTRPLLRLKPSYRYLLVPLTFWVGNLMSLVVPSASSLAVLLMTTLFPTMVAAGLSRLTAAAVIATTATIMPTPLGADNVAAAAKLGLDLNQYTWAMHAKISIPVLVLIGVVHYFWQRFLDSRDAQVLETAQATASTSGHASGAGVATLTGGAPASTTRPSTGGSGTGASGDARTAPAWYCVFPLLPLVLVLVPWLLDKWGGPHLSISLLPVVLICLTVTILVDMIVGRLSGRRALDALDDAKTFVTGMGDGMASVVGLLIAAAVLVEGIQKLGVIDLLIRTAENMPGGAWIVIGVFVVMMLVLTLLTGGVAPFYSFVEAVPSVASGLAISGAWLTLPLQFIGNLMRACSPVAAVVLIVASSVGTSPLHLIKRTSVPMIVGLVASLTMTWILI